MATGNHSQELYHMFGPNTPAATLIAIDKLFKKEDPWKGLSFV